MSPAPVRAKFSIETRTQVVDFGAKLAAGDTLLPGATVTAEPLGLVATVLAVGVDTVSLRVGGGLDRHDYTVRVKAPTAFGDTIEEDLVVEVRD